MSQAKVDRYKEEKRNRAKIMKRQKMEWLLTKVVLALIAVVIVGWAAISVYHNVTAVPEGAVEEVENYTVNTSALDDYLRGLTQE